MSTTRTRGLPARLEGVRRRFDRWRKTHAARTRIPEPLWAAAVKMAEMYGIHRAAKALRLDYYSVKRRVEEKVGTAGKMPKEPAAATFLELAPSPRGEAYECTVEFEDSSGSKMRVHLKGGQTPDLAALSRSFWRAEA